MSLTYGQTLQVIERRPECGPRGNRVRDVVCAMLVEARRRGVDFVMPSVKALQRLCGCDRRTVQRAFGKLRSLFVRKYRWRFIEGRAVQLASSIAYVAQLIGGGNGAALSFSSKKKSMETTAAAPFGGPPVVSDARSAMFADLETIRSGPNATFWERNFSQWRQEHPGLRARVRLG